MKDTPVGKVRNFAIAGHAGSGKTALADLILFKSGTVNRLGRKEDKTSVSDYRDEEKEKGHSIYATPLHGKWQDHQLFFIDTPGSPDFQGETTAALNVCDTALIVIDAVNGIGVGTSRAWRLGSDRQTPRLIFVNAIDHENTDYFSTLAAIQETFGKTVCVPFTLPVGVAAGFSGVVQVLNGQNVPEELADQVETYRGALMDAAAEADEELMLRYLDGQPLSEAEIVSGLKAAIRQGKLVPVFCGSATKDLGVAELLKAIVDLCPDPLARKSIATANGQELVLKPSGDGVGFVFKSVIDPFIGQMTFVRVYSGTMRADAELKNIGRGHAERFGGFLLLNGREQETVTEVSAGDIVAIPKLKNTHINDTLATVTTAPALPPIVFPRPTMFCAVYALKRGEEDKIASGLQRLCDEDPTVKMDRNPETHELVISGLGDQHLSNVIHRLKASAKVDVELKTPKVPYRETVTRAGDARYRHKKQSGGHGQFAEVWLRVEPLADGDFEFASEVVGGHISKNYIPAVEKGVVSAMDRGPLARCKVTRIRAAVYDGKEHAVDSSDIAFQIAARAAFREAFRNATPILLEPIMKVAISAPEAYMGDISGDLNHRRGRILGMDRAEGLQVVIAEVPQAEMFSYSSQLRSLTQGRGSFEMEFARYEQVPGNISKQIQEQAASEALEE